MSEMPILQVKNLHTSFVTDAGEVKAWTGARYWALWERAAAARAFPPTP